MYWIFFFIGARFLGAMVICPIFNDSLVPKMLKAVLAGLFTVIVFPHYMHMAVSRDIFLNIMTLGAEFVIGIVLGYIFSLPIWLIENVGNLIDTQRGEQFGAVVNPITKDPASSISKLLLQTFITYIISIGGLLFFIKFVVLSFANWPPAHFFFAAKHYDLLIKAFAQYFTFTIVFALPVLLAMYLLELVLGLFSSFIQQLNVTVLAMALKSVLALLILVIYVGSLYHFVIVRFDNENLFHLFQI